MVRERAIQAARAAITGRPSSLINEVKSRLELGGDSGRAVSCGERRIAADGFQDLRMHTRVPDRELRSIRFRALGIGDAGQSSVVVSKRASAAALPRRNSRMLTPAASASARSQFGERLSEFCLSSQKLGTAGYRLSQDAANLLILG